MAAEPTTPLLAELAARYRLHPESIEFFVGPRLRKLGAAATSLADLRGIVPPAQLHQILYNLSHVERGERLLALAQARLTPRAAATPAVLDIGCGIGGTLIAFGQAGFRLHGIELSAARQAMCARNLAQNGLEARLDSLDLCERGMEGQRFDVVVCNSVIEHVGDPPAMIRRFGELLAPGGVLLMGVANCDALGNAISDPHYGIFGLTFTPAPLAAALYDALAEQKQSYSVTEWHPIDRYAAAIEAAVGPVERIAPADDTRGMAAVPGLVARVAGALEAALARPGLAQRPELKAPLEAATAAYLARACEAWGRVAEGWGERRFLETYMRKSFQLVAVRR